MDEVHQPAGHVFRCALWVYLGALDQIVVRKPDWTFFCQVWTKKMLDEYKAETLCLSQLIGEIRQHLQGLSDYCKKILPLFR